MLLSVSSDQLIGHDLSASGALRCEINNGGCWKKTQDGRSYSACIVSGGRISLSLSTMSCFLAYNISELPMDSAGRPFQGLQVSTRIQGWWSQLMWRYCILSLFKCQRKPKYLSGSDEDHWTCWGTIIVLWFHSQSS